jgi:solute carrier family 25 (adenine nucleotide translocator) protein 4/5/6/31
MASDDVVYVKLSFLEDFMLSGTAAVTSKTIAAPIERIKMVVQNQDEMLKRGSLERPFIGIMDCARWIVANEGPVAFWKSNFTNCIRYFPTQALNFAFKGSVKKLAALKTNKADSYALGLAKNITAGGLAGTGSLAFVYSLDYARTRLANDLKGKGGGERQFTGLFDVYKKTIATDGVAGLYRGFVISAVGIFVYRGLYFGLYDTIMPMFSAENTNLGTRFVVGYCVTVAAGLASYPIDTIRRRMMMTSGGDKSMMYKGSLDCAAQIMKNEGVKSFFKGAGANILRGVAGAGVLAGFETVSEAYIKYAYGANAVAKK